MGGGSSPSASSRNSSTSPNRPKVPARRTRENSGRTSSPRPHLSFASRPSNSSASFIQPTYQALIDGARYCEPRLREIIATHHPDVIVEDNVVLFPALVTSRGAIRADRVVQPARGARPWRAATVLRAARVADRVMGRAIAPSSTAPIARMWADFDAWVRAQGEPTPCRSWSSCRAPNAANLYVYPAEADYLDARPLDGSWTRMDSSVRETDEEYALPAEVADRPADSALIYLSLGSLGGADVELMQRLVDVLGTHAGTGSSSARDRRRIEIDVAGQHGRCPDGAADQGHPAGRPGDHRTVATTPSPRRCTSASP